MSYVAIPSIHRDPTIASSMIVQDYISKHVRKDKPISARHKPKGVDSPFGNFPRSYKRADQWDGNPTLRRDARTTYDSPARSPDKARRTAQVPRRSLRTHSPPLVVLRYTYLGYEVFTTISGSSVRPASAKAGGRQNRQSPEGVSVSQLRAGTRTTRPKSASACQLARTRLSGAVGPEGANHGQGTGKGTEGQHRRERAQQAWGEAGDRQLGLGEQTERPQPKFTGASVKGRQQHQGDDLFNKEELEATRDYLLKKGKFRMTPTKLMSNLEVAKATKTRPLSAPACMRRKRGSPAPKAGAWRRRSIADTLFRKFYVRGDLPVCVDHRANRNAIKWKIRTSDLDYHVYLPIFFEGLREAS
ncbi:unnamed protein product [Discosporangium mesarthrocarpum]